MRRLFLLLLFCNCLFVVAQERPYDHVIFVNSRMPGNYFYSEGSYSAPSWIKNIRGRLPVTDSIYFTPGNCLQLHYKNGRSGTWQARIFQPAWRGQDNLKPATILSFKIFVASNTAGEALPAVSLANKDTIKSSLVQVGTYLQQQFTPGKWHPVRIPLTDFTGLDQGGSQNIRSISFRQSSQDEGEYIVYIDNIELTNSAMSTVHTIPTISEAKGYAKHVDITWQAINDPGVKYIKIYRSADDGLTYTPVGIQQPFINRYADFTNQTAKRYKYKLSCVGYDDNEGARSAAATAATRLMSDSELLTMVQEACFRFYWEGAEARSGLAKENIPGRHNMVAVGASGFGIMALLAGTERKFITRRQAVSRFLKITAFLESAQKFHGAFSHFIDGPSGKVEPFFGQRDNGGDLVETSFLIQGLLAAKAYFRQATPEEQLIRNRITNIWLGVEWDWYRRYPDNKFLVWHWSPDKEWIINHSLIGWNETMVTYLLAIASPTHAVPASLYYSGWANPDSAGRKYRMNWGQTADGAGYLNGNTYFGIKLPVGVSNGGPLFFTHYSYLGYDPHKITDRYTNYFENNRSIALINHRYCIENPGNYLGYGDSCWGLTASDGPYHYAASEPNPRNDQGKIAPTGAISSFPYTPAESMKALKNYYYNYGSFLWGEYGFRDAFNLSDNWCSDIYMGLNQAPMIVMIENYRSGLLWNLFMSNPEIKEGLAKIKH